MPFYGQYTGFGSGSDAPVLSLIDILTTLGLTTGLKLCLDAGDANSYTSGGQWLDTSGGGYDMDFGASASAASDDPTFNGVAGGLSSAEYMSFDGGDHFEYETTIATWQNNLHKANAEFAWFVVQYFAAPADDGYVFATSASGAAQGVQMKNHDSSHHQGVYVVGSSGVALYNSTDTTLSQDAWNMTATHLDEAGGSSASFHWANGAYNQVSSSDTWDGAYSSPSSSSADNFYIGKRGNGNGYPDGVRMSCLAVWEGSGLPTKTNFDDIRTNLLIRGF